MFVHSFGRKKVQQNQYFTLLLASYFTVLRVANNVSLH